MTSDHAPRPRSTVRPPQQERSRVSWERILDAGTQLLEEEGFEALTITAVCRRAGVSAPTIYARVDGLAGLFWAIYERGILAVSRSQDRYLTAAGVAPAASAERITLVVGAACSTFEEHKRFLQPVIRFASMNGALLARGSDSSQNLVDQMAGLLPAGEEGAADAVARMVYAECVFRVMYGDHFLGHAAESFDDFVARITSMALARLS